MPGFGETYLKALPGQLLRMVLYLAIIAGLHFTRVLVLDAPLRWTLVGVIVAAALVPPRFSEIATGVGFLIVGWVGYYHYGNTLVGVLCGVFGAWSLVEGARGFMARAGA